MDKRTQKEIKKKTSLKTCPIREIERVTIRCAECFGNLLQFFDRELASLKSFVEGLGSDTQRPCYRRLRLAGMRTCQFDFLPHI